MSEVTGRELYHLFKVDPIGQRLWEYLKDTYYHRLSYTLGASREEVFYHEGERHVVADLMERMVEFMPIPDESDAVVRFDSRGGLFDQSVDVFNDPPDDDVTDMAL